MTPQEIQKRMIQAVKSHGYSPSSWERDKKRPDVFQSIIGVRYAYQLMCGSFKGRSKQIRLMRDFYRLQDLLEQFEEKHKNA